MINFERIAGFDWDEGNSRKSVEKHGVSQMEAEQVFFNQPLLMIEDVRHHQKESRWQVLGMTDERRLLHITFTLRADNKLIRIISARTMSQKERKQYEKIYSIYTPI